MSTTHAEVLQGLLQRAVIETLGRDPGSTEGLLRFLRAFAPGLAMRYAGRPKEMGPCGILGLLLTAAAARATISDAFVIPLDEHPWLYGRAGLRADVIAVWSREQTLNLKVLEAKYLMRPSDSELDPARQQVTRTCSVLEAWTTSSAMKAYFRRKVYDALLPWRHDPVTPDIVGPLLPIVLDQEVQIRIAGPAEVHVWISETDAPHSEHNVDGVRSIVHSLSETREALGGLCGTLVLKQKSRTVYFESPTQLLDYFRLPKDGAQYRRIKAAFQRSFASTIFFGTQTDTKQQIVVDSARFHFMDSVRLWFSCSGEPQSAECELSNNAITLSEAFYQEVLAHPIPVEREVIAALAHAPGLLDFYVWIAWKGWTVNGQPARILILGTNGLNLQLGTAQYSVDRLFRHKISQWLRHVKLLWPECPAYVSCDGRFLVVQSSRQSPALHPAERHKPRCCAAAQKR